MATSFLQLKANEVRSNRVSWQTYLQSRIVTQDEYVLMTKLDGTADQKAAMLAEKPLQCIQTLLHLAVHINKDQTTQYITTMINDLLQQDKQYVQMFHNCARAKNEHAWTSLLSLLKRPDKFTAYQTGQIIARLASWSKERMEGNDLAYYLTWLKDQLTLPKNDFIETAANCLQTMLRVATYRSAFVEKDGIGAILSVLNSKVGFQLHYQLIFCLWVITFDPKLANKVTKCNVIPTLSDILSETVKEKVTRIILATFKNLLDKPTEPELKRENALAMIQGKVLKHLQLLDGKKYEDSDVTEDMQYLIETLEVNIRDVSSFEEYSSELKSGRLEWSLVHKSEKFWTENVTHLNEKNFELLKILVALLANTREAVTRAVAVHDIGEYVRHYPRGKTILEQLGGKQHVMACLSHEDSNVRYEALIALQKIMVHNWEYLGKQVEAPTTNAKEGVTSVKM